MAKRKGFLADEDQKVPPDSFPDKCVFRLVDAMRRHNLLTRAVNAARWRKEFEKLLEHNSEAKVDAALSWYAKHAGDKGVPKIYSAETFRKCFKQLCDKAVGSKDSQIELHDFVKKAHVWYKGGHWPKGSDQQLPAFLQTTWDNYTAYHAKLLKVKTELDKILDGWNNVKHPGYKDAVKEKHGEAEYKRRWGLSKCRNLLDYLLSTSLKHPKVFLENWANVIQGTIVNWHDWEGNLMGLAFREDHPRFRKIMLGCAYDFCTDSTRWNDLEQAIEEYGK